MGQFALPWHRILGLALADHFIGTPFDVDLEIDLSRRKQLLDIVIIRKGPGGDIAEVPDGLEDLALFNLLTYKSLSDHVDSWAVAELLGHYVNFRKQISPDLNNLFPPEIFRLYAVATRSPRKLRRETPLHPVKQGVYEVLWGTHRIRVISLREVPQEPRNAIWLLFSGDPAKVEFASIIHQWKSSQHSSIVKALYERYKLEGLEMPYTWQDYYRDLTRATLDELTPEERLKGLPPEERIKGLPPEERIKGLRAEEILAALPWEEIKAFIKKRSQQGDNGQNGQQSLEGSLPKE